MNDIVRTARRSGSARNSDERGPCSVNMTALVGYLRVSPHSCAGEDGHLPFRGSACYNGHGAPRTRKVPTFRCMAEIPGLPSTPVDVRKRYYPMPHELALELLTIGRIPEAPSAADLVRVLATSGLASVEVYTPPEQRAGSGASAAGRRPRLGSYTLRARSGEMSARLLISRTETPVTQGMPEAALNGLARDLSADDGATLRTGTLALDLRISGTGPKLAVLTWAMSLAKALADLTQGVVLDPAAQRCLGRQHLMRLPLGQAAGHIAVHAEVWSGDTRWLHTHGLQKFARPELELVQVPSALEEEGLSVLWQLAEMLAGGAELHPGQIAVVEGAGDALALPTSPDADHQAPFGRLRLADLAAPGQRQGNSPRSLLARMALAQAETTADRDPASALEIADRLLAADADDCAALLLKARTYLRVNQASDALELGQLMEMRVARDYRGPLAVGLALIGMGRYQEALLALDRAAEREPEAPEIFTARAEAHAHLGNARQATLDRSRASYLTV